MQGVWSLGNVVGDSLKCRNLVLSQGTLIPLLRNAIDTTTYKYFCFLEHFSVSLSFYPFLFAADYNFDKTTIIYIELVHGQHIFVIQESSGEGLFLYLFNTGHSCYC